MVVREEAPTEHPRAICHKIAYDPERQCHADQPAKPFTGMLYRANPLDAADDNASRIGSSVIGSCKQQSFQEENPDIDGHYNHEEEKLPPVSSTGYL